MSKDLKVTIALAKDYVQTKDEENIHTTLGYIKTSTKNITKIKGVNDVRLLISTWNATINYTNDDNKKIMSSINQLIEKWIILGTNKWTIVVNPQIKDFYSSIEENFNKN